ncbi:MAG: alkaline phosphatase family protein [Candidatus Helarchaeota archaeon]
MKLELRNLASKYKNIRFEDGLYLPNFDKSLYKLRSTYEYLLGIRKDEKSLLEYKDIEKIIKEHHCFNAKNIINITIDSMGLNQLVSSNNFLKEYKENNEIIELSSLFPTITSSILTSIHSGLPPERHGVLGHKIFFPEIGAIINTLIMNVANAKNNSKDALVNSGVNAKSLLWEYRSPSLYESKNYKQINLLQFDIAMTGLSHLMIDQHSVVSFRNLIDGFEKLKILLKRKEKLYIHFYIGDIDEISHIYGPYSEQFKITSDYLNYILKKFIRSLDPKIAEETILTITADHGQNPIFDDKRIIFNDEEIKQYQKYLTAPMGKSGRLLHFYSKSDKIDNLKNLLDEKFRDSALILTRYDDLKPLFSSEYNYERLYSRLGDIFIILKPNYAVERNHNSEHKEELIEFIMQGTHGSLSEDELIVPLFIDKISNYQKELDNK